MQSIDVSLVEEDSEDEAGPSTAHRQDRKRDRSGRSTTRAAGNDVPREIESYQWLSAHSRMNGVYVPQVGDEVVYIRKGHEVALEQFPSNLTPPWVAIPRGISMRPTETCIVKEMEYFIKDEEARGTCVVLTLELSDQTSALKVCQYC